MKGTMKARVLMKYLAVVTAVLAIAGCAAMVGTAGIADRSRTGTIHDVQFEERMTPANLHVRHGDEVRWVNRRSMPAINPAGM